ncbi:hypothetical protein DSO57_1001042 [Entomophthora muscae]|uniref:Uncharacterized protein n=1 Tax=Entomophthora muscae TaxID=34485 RepID=A0ACC2UW44_9FUNG|nr:hypothetical protein DSO57_1001042 [Entomophthora muscae]
MFRGLHMSGARVSANLHGNRCAPIGDVGVGQQLGELHLLVTGGISSSEQKVAEEIQEISTVHSCRYFDTTAKLSTAMVGVDLAAFQDDLEAVFIAYLCYGQVGGWLLLTLTS